MTPRFTISLAAVLGSIALAAPLAAENAAPMAQIEAGAPALKLDTATASMATASTLDAAKMGQAGVSIGLASAPLIGVRNQDNILS